MEDIKKLFNILEKYSLNKEQCLHELMAEYHNVSYTPYVYMNCMDYKIIMSEDERCNLNTFRIAFKTKEEYDYNEFELQEGISGNVCLELNSIIRGITPLNLDNMVYESTDIYSFTIQACEFYYSEEIADHFVEYEADLPLLTIKIYHNESNDNYVEWHLSSTAGSTGYNFIMKWTYAEYIEFYSHIIQTIVNNLDKLKNYHN